MFLFLPFHRVNPQSMRVDLLLLLHWKPRVCVCVCVKPQSCGGLVKQPLSLCSSSSLCCDSILCLLIIIREVCHTVVPWAMCTWSNLNSMQVGQLCYLPHEANDHSHWDCTVMFKGSSKLVNMSGHGIVYYVYHGILYNKWHFHIYERWDDSSE